jgi:site-specific DNA-methyltransferase (adenine-specific)
MLGDCLERMAELPDASVDMILCDLPYGTTACAWDEVIPFEPLWAEYRRLMAPCGSVVLTANQPFSSALVASNYAMFKYSWIWVKNRPTLAVHAKNRPMGKHEEVLVFSNAPMGHVSQLAERRMRYNPQGAVSTGQTKVIKERGSQPSYNKARPNLVGREYETMTGFPHTILEIAKEETHFHPTQKPVALFEYLIRTYTDEGMAVLDNCSGSGTTAIAAERTGRRWICIERDTEYYAKACERVETEIASKGLFT